VCKAYLRAEPFLSCGLAERMNNYNLATLTLRLGILTSGVATPAR